MDNLTKLEKYTFISEVSRIIFSVPVAKLAALMSVFYLILFYLKFSIKEKQLQNNFKNNIILQNRELVPVGKPKFSGIYKLESLFQWKNCK
jgi:hypothetical protein